MWTLPQVELFYCAPLACCRRLDRLPCAMETRKANCETEKTAAGPTSERSLIQSYVIDREQGALESCMQSSVMKPTGEVLVLPVRL